MQKKLSPWCKKAKIAMIQNDTMSVLLTDSSNNCRTYSGGVRTSDSHDSSVLIGMLYLLENSALETPM